jgi:hypothetical protein
MFDILRAAGRTIVSGAFSGRSWVGDIETEYDEFDIDAELELRVRAQGWLEPSW